MDRKQKIEMLKKIAEGKGRLFDFLPNLLIVFKREDGLNTVHDGYVNELLLTDEQLKSIKCKKLTFPSEFNSL